MIEIALTVVVLVLGYVVYGEGRNADTLEERIDLLENRLVALERTVSELDCRHAADALRLSGLNPPPPRVDVGGVELKGL